MIKYESFIYKVMFSLLSKLRLFAVINVVIHVASISVAMNCNGKEGIALESDGITMKEVRHGTTVNITCINQFPFCQWWKDGARRFENHRTIWIQGKKEINHGKCYIKKLMIRNFTSNDTGLYTCYAMKFPKLGKKKTLQEYSIFLKAVSCYKGYYCGSNHNETKRCPIGSFSLHDNASSIKDCHKCGELHKRKVIIRTMDERTAARFQTNCVPDSSKVLKSTLMISKAALISVIIASLALALAIIIGIRKWKKKMDEADEEKLFPKEIDYEKPHLERCNDVFICYSSKDSAWVKNTLYSNLISQGFRTILDYFDFELGVTIHENIINSIYSSRKTLFVLSNHSLKSFYARRELHQALSAGCTGHQVIILQYDKCKTPIDVVHTEYLDWTDVKKRKLFWQQLYEAIRRPLVTETIV